jgi:hypothetical protein
MKSNYKSLGDFIWLVAGRNPNLQDIPLVGLSINKVFIPSILQWKGMKSLLRFLSKQKTIRKIKTNKHSRNYWKSKNCTDKKYSFQNDN